MTIRSERQGPVTVVTIDRPERRNAVDGPAADALVRVLRDFDADSGAQVAVLTGAGGFFCAGSDLKAMAAGEFPVPTVDGPPPLGPTRLRLTKPVIAAIEGAEFPQDAVRAARDTAISQWYLSEEDALRAEARRALAGAG